MTDTKLTSDQRVLADIALLLDALGVSSPDIVRKWIAKLTVQLGVTAELLTALELLAAGPSDDWRDATDDDDGYTRTPRERALKQARAAIAKAKSSGSE